MWLSGIDSVEILSRSSLKVKRRILENVNLVNGLSRSGVRDVGSWRIVEFRGQVIRMKILVSISHCTRWVEANFSRLKRALL